MSQGSSDEKNVRICTMCRREFEKDPLVVIDGDLCPECRKTYSGLGFVWCNTCKEIITRVKPGFAKNGYFVRAGETLHVNECPVCRPGLRFSVPVEFERFRKEKDAARR